MSNVINLEEYRGSSHVVGSSTGGCAKWSSARGGGVKIGRANG